MKRKTIVLTGASDGIGAAAAQILSNHQHQLILVGRSENKTKRIAEKVKARHYFTADYENLPSVIELTEKILDCCPVIDVLVNNAGGIFSGPTKTSDGFEKSFQVNHLAQFLLTNRLMDRLVDSQACIVNTSSIGARLYGKINIEDMNTWQKFSPNRAYGNGKLANILFTKELHKRYHEQGISAVAFHPGNVATNFASETNSYFRYVYHSFLKMFLISVQRGGENLVHFIEGTPNKEWESGQFYGSHRKISRTNPQAYNQELIQQHWDKSNEMLRDYLM